jgi:hypothetical protein
MSQIPPQVGPIPVQPLYALPVVPARPGIITAIGIISIVVAALSLLGGLVTALWSFSFLMISAVSSAAFTPPAPATAPAPMLTSQVTTAPSLRVTSSGFEEADRAIVLEAMESVRPLSDARHKQMDKLLAKCGKQIFPIGNLKLYKAVTNAINDSGQSYSSNGNGPDYFVLAKGRIEVNDDRALFDPLDGGEKVRVADDEPEEDSNALTPAEIDAIIKKSQQMAQQKLTPQQIAGWTSELQDPNQSLFTSTNKPARTAQQLITVTVQPDGSAMFQTRTGFVSMAQNGGILFSSSTMTAGWGRAGGGPPIKINKGAAAMAMTDAIGGLLLAILLLIAGILALRQSPRARRLHLIYALIKIPLVIVGTIGWAWMMHDLMTSLSKTVGVAPMAGMRPMSTAMMTVGIIGCIYPIALLIVLNTRSVKEYYASGQ